MKGALIFLINYLNHHQFNSTYTYKHTVKSTEPTRTNFAFHIFSFRVFWAFFCLFVKSHSLWWWQDQRNIIWIQNWYQSQQKKHFLFQIAELYSIRCDRLSTYPPDCHCCHNNIQYSQCSKKLEKSAKSLEIFLQCFSQEGTSA